MKLTLLVSLTTLALPALSMPFEAKRQTAVPDDATITRLAPDLGFAAGVNPTGTGDCDGAVNGADGKPVKVPCTCPPSSDVYIPALIKNVQAGFAVNNPTVKVSFPTGDSAQDQATRKTAAAITLQNLNGPGQGCPIASTKLGVSRRDVNKGPEDPDCPPDATPTGPPPPMKTPPADNTPPKNDSPANNPPANNTTPANNPVHVRNYMARDGTPDAATITGLAPSLGFQSGENPTGTGDCDGAVNGSDGKPVKIPCTCPPAQDVYIAALVKNVQAGFAVNNPSVKISYPTDNSNQSQSARITAALVTLQNLNGPGEGCPAASTTLGAQQKALGS